MSPKENTETMPTRKRAFLSGAGAMVPILLGDTPFALLAGIAAIKVGFTKLEALGMSYIVFAGASQLAAIELVGRHASAVVIILTALLINLRLGMYSASLAPHFAELPLGWRGILAYFLTDEGYALSISAYNDGRRQFKHWFYLGGSLLLWSVWVAGTLTGAIVGGHIPQGWSLEFAVPLTFLALLFPTISDRPTLLAAACAGALAIAAHGLPYNLGLLLATLGGILGGCLAEGRPNDAT